MTSTRWMRRRARLPPWLGRSPTRRMCSYSHRPACRRSLCGSAKRTSRAGVSIQSMFLTLSAPPTAGTQSARFTKAIVSSTSPPSLRQPTVTPFRRSARSPYGALRGITCHSASWPIFTRPPGVHCAARRCSPRSDDHVQRRGRRRQSVCGGSAEPHRPTFAAFRGLYRVCRHGGRAGPLPARTTHPFPPGGAGYRPFAVGGNGQLPQPTSRSFEHSICAGGRGACCLGHGTAALTRLADWICGVVWHYVAQLDHDDLPL